MNGQQDRCKSEELDTSPELWIRSCHPPHSPSDHENPHTPESQAEVRVLNLHIKLLNLSKKNQELLHINKKWAEQYTILRLHFEHQVTELKRRLKVCEWKKEENEQRMEDLTNSTEESPQVTELKSSLQEADRELERLRMQCDILTNRGQQQEEEIRRLNKRVQKGLAVQQESVQTEENIWRHQAQVYKEDFLKERRDRDKLREKYTELEKRFKKIHAELHVHKAQVRWDLSHPSTGPLQHT